MSKAEAQAIIHEQASLEHKREPLDEVWQEVADFAAPDAPDFGRYRIMPNSRHSQAEREHRRGSQIYDTTIIEAIQRLCAGLESLITPQSEKWHSFTTADINDAETEEEKEWAERLRDLLFSIRYQPKANFVPAIQQVYRNVVRFGPAYMFPAEVPGSPNRIRYMSIPTSEGYIAYDRWGLPQRFHRKYVRSAFQVAQIMGPKCPAKIRDMANDSRKKYEEFTLIQAISKKPDGKRISITMPDGSPRFIDMPWQSQHILEEEEVIAREAGFLTFPVATFSWERDEGDDYGTSPCIKALTVTREQNGVRKAGLTALEMNIRPTLGLHEDLDFIPTLNPGAHIPGLINADGKQLFQPLNTGANPDFAFNYAKENAVVLQAHLFRNLFQILIDNPQMTATEALLRNQEKGELIGPTGSVIQSGLADLADRELAILEDAGLYAPDSIYLPPSTLAGRQIRVGFTSPLDVLRRSAEASDTIELVSAAANLAEVTGNPAVMDKIDTDAALDVIHSAKRAPQRVMRRPDAVAAMREQRAKEAQAQKGIATLETGSNIAKNLTPALQSMAESGGLAPPAE